MQELLTLIQAHLADWIFAAITALIGLGYRRISRKLEAEHVKNNAVADGVQALLRQGIIDNYNKYAERGCCPIYAKDAIEKAYAAYHNLGGNGTITKLWEEIKNMPTERRDDDV